MEDKLTDLSSVVLQVIETECHLREEGAWQNGSCQFCGSGVFL